MMKMLRPGDIVEVRSAQGILCSLDVGGAVGGLPFMPEMAEFCGKRFLVSERVVQSTMDALAAHPYSGSYVREFKNDDVVFLEDLRCSGVYHGG
jgi:hypothetical protein